MKTKQVTGGGWRVAGKQWLRAGLMALGLALMAPVIQAAQFQLTPIPVSTNLFNVQTNGGGSATLWITNNGGAFPWPQNTDANVIYANVTVTGTNNASALKLSLGFDESGDPTPPYPISNPTNFTTTQPLYVTATLPATPAYGYTNIVLAIPLPTLGTAGTNAGQGVAYGKLTEVYINGGTNVTINWLGLGTYY